VKPNRYKVLSVPSYVRSSRVCNEAMSNMDFVKCSPVFNRDGWYYDRFDKKSWVEHDGVAWKKENGDLESSFMHALRMLNAVVLTREEQSLLRRVVRKNIRSDLTKLVDSILFDHLCVSAPREVGRNMQSD
jgi:hypothetical protein